MQISLHQDHAITPKSILRHRPIGGGTTLTPLPQVPERASRTQTMGSPTTRTSWTRTTKTHTHPTEEQNASLHWLGFVGLGMCTAILLALLATGIIQWGETAWQQIHYGSPRTFQTDAFVGDPAEKQQTPSHFIATNLNGHIDIFEIPGNDAAHTHIYVGPIITGPQANQVPVTLQFIAHGDPRYPDMIVKVGTTQVLYRNIHGVFQPQ